MRSPIIAHGASNPDPEPGFGQPGPGQFRIYAPSSKYVPVDPLRHGQGNDVSQSPFAMGPRSNLREGSEFRTLDVSRYNERHHNWQRIDTFQTPSGHLGDRPLVPDIEEAPVCAFRPDYLEALRRNVRDDLRSEIHEVTTMLRELRKDISQVSEEVRAVGESVNSPEMLAEIRRVKTEVDFSPVLAEIQKGEAASAKLSEEIQRVKGEIDFSPVLEEVRKLQELRRAKPFIDFSVVTDAIRQTQDNLSAELRKAKNDAVIEGIRKFKTEVEPRPVQAHVDFAPLVEEIQKLKAGLPFERVFDEINKSKTDLQPVLARAARIIEEIRKGKTEVMQQLQKGSDLRLSTTRKPPTETQPMALTDKRDFQLEINEEGHLQRVDFSLRTGEVLQIPVSPRAPSATRPQ